MATPLDSLTGTSQSKITNPKTEMVRKLECPEIPTHSHIADQMPVSSCANVQPSSNLRVLLRVLERSTSLLMVVTFMI